jgi:hypothetical protein
MRTNPRTVVPLALATVFSLTACPDAKDEEGGKDSGAERGSEGSEEPKPAVKTEASSK